MFAKYAKVIILLFFSLLFNLILAEGVLRWYYFGLPTSKSHLPHPYLQSILNPGIEIKPGEFLGQLGTRKTGVYHEGDPYQIIAVGDSTTFSVASSDESQSYPTLLENALRVTLGRPVEVYNAGVPGYNSLQMLLRLHHLLRFVSPDEVIIYGGWNDFRVLLHDRGTLYIENNALGLPKAYRHRTYWELSQKVAGRLNRWLSRSFFFNHVTFKINAHYIKKDITAFWRKNGLESIPKPPLVIPEIVDNYRNNIASIISLSKGRGAKVSVITLGTPLRERYSPETEEKFMKAYGRDLGNFLRLTPAEQYYYVKKFNEVLRQLAKQYDTRLYDWDKWYKEVDDFSLFKDVVHPNGRGYEFLVSKIVSARTGP
jgi:lysophospholipase L1-like esterase